MLIPKLSIMMNDVSRSGMVVMASTPGRFAVGCIGAVSPTDAQLVAYSYRVVAFELHLNELGTDNPLAFGIFASMMSPVSGYAYTPSMLKVIQP